MSEFKVGDWVVVDGRSKIYQIKYYMNMGCGYQMQCGARFSYSMVERLATAKEIKQGIGMSKQFRNAQIIVYPTVDGMSRFEYKNHVVQTYGYDDGKPDLNLTHVIIDEHGDDLVEYDCLIKCINYIDGRARRSKLKGISG